ncbi:pentatricopeptide repeat-containing protein At2g01860 [Elaeis guineensis]|uniref:Pentatricopeptide repeat-containing protein At2g01860 n=1 Tax=Elaeis guineensis var. tenera TaxID=51953 RepID=A0A6I9S139_ELAGV|nr:pentatricopeptide repeat-containing protein At2g01860 [Elaeis guineensis]XP_010935300.1 pentatricopeptide repeat-containing protein At2g01860 [Elaeis guineensis]XP_029123455.1 pentatricopeptide repeat-containing protein At2g01860 [Elaeis guineensis]
MEHLLATSSGIRLVLPETQTQHFRPIPGTKFNSNWMHAPSRVIAQSRSNKSPSRRKLPKNLRYPRRAKLPPDPGINRVPVKKEGGIAQLFDDIPKKEEEKKDSAESSKNEDREADTDDSVWSKDELEAISSLFERRMPQKPVKPAKDRQLPLPLPHKVRPLEIPTPKHHVRLAISWRSSFSDQVRKNPEVLVGIAREIGALPPDADVSEVLDRWARFLRKGSLSMTIRELGHMGLPERALQTLCWAQKQQGLGLFPDDRILASTVEVLARFGQLKIEAEMEKYLNSASRVVIEAMAKGFIRAGNLNRARKILLLAKDNERTLDASIHAKLILEAGKTPDGYKLASALLDELGEREDFDLKLQDCTAIMKVCIRLGKFEAVESLFNWFKQSGRSPTVVMYTTVIYSRYCNKKYREALVLVWEMEELNCLLDLPAYRVMIRLCVTLNDLARAVRYFSRLKEAGFAPTYEIYCDMIKAYAASGRLAKCRQVCREIEMAGLRLDKETISLLSEMEGQVRSVC